MNEYKVSIEKASNKSNDNYSNIFVGGDFAISNIDQSASPDEILSSEVHNAISTSEIALVNYEGVTATGLDPVFKRGPVVEIDETCPDLLADAGFTGVTLANNHIVDYGSDGIVQTRKHCCDAGLETLGIGSNSREAHEPSRYECSDTSISIFNFSENPFNTHIQDDFNPQIADRQDPHLIQKITEEKSSTDVLIAISHAGFMNIPIPPLQLKKYYQNLIDIGIDIVVGHHPHVPQGWERHQDGIIFYSLGNFLYNREGRGTTFQENWGITLQIAVSDGGVRHIEITPIEVVEQTVYPLGKIRDLDEYSSRLNRMCEIASDTEKLENFWMAIAEKYYEDNSENIINIDERHLHNIIWTSNRSMLETALTVRATDTNVPKKIIEESYEIWKWSDVDPYETKTTKKFDLLAKCLYSGPVRSFSKRIGVHQKLIEIYFKTKSILRDKRL